MKVKIVILILEHSKQYINVFNNFSINFLIVVSIETLLYHAIKIILGY